MEMPRAHGTKKSREVFVYMRQLIAELRATLGKELGGALLTSSHGSHLLAHHLIVAFVLYHCVSREIDAELAARRKIPLRGEDKSGALHASECDA